MTDEQYQLAKKYPNIFDGNLISLSKVGNILQISEQFKNDKQTLQLLKLENFKTDIAYIFGDIKRTRKYKLLKLKNLNK